MTRIAAATLAALLAAFQGTVHAESVPLRVAEIRFAGNSVTRDHVLMRELDFRVGDELTPERIENSRQSIADLALFREVKVDYDAGPAGAIVTIRVREKRFLLPIPRVDGDSDGSSSYGAQLRWNNVAGLNHSLDARVISGKPDDRVAESEHQLRVSYAAPYLFGDSTGLVTDYEYTRRDAVGPSGIFDERVDRFELRVTNDRRTNRPRSGWILGVGPSWRRQGADGALAPPADGTATALVFTAAHSDLRYHLYSETGSILGVRLESARNGWLSDYSYSRFDTEYRRYIGLAGGPHHTLGLIGAVGWSTGRSDWRNTFSMGGTSRMRGYELDFIEGDSYGYAAVEWLHPLGHNWLRFLAVAEVGGTSRSINAAPDGGPYASVGVGVRIRLPWFVGVELEVGVAQPLNDGDGPRLFAGSVR